MKRLAALMLFALTLTMLFCAACEEKEHTYFMGGGIVERGGGNPLARGLISELTVAYLTTGSAYLEKGRQASWTIVASGGDGNYTYQFRLFYRERPLPENSDELFYLEASQSFSSANTFFHTPVRDDGQYLLEVRVQDSAGDYIVWQSPVYEMASEEATILKAEAVAAQCLQEAAPNDYARALWLHDWLIDNADYDYSFTYYYADGVLLHGKGVCQSYAYAYEMLLKLIGIDCVYITGVAGGGPHGWNLVNLDGEWYHVDVTWDDPGEGGILHDYFFITDEIMSRDHSWEDEGNIMPVCDSEEYLYRAHGDVFVVESEEAFFDAINRMIDENRQYAEFINTGADENFSLLESVKVFAEVHMPVSSLYGMQYSMNAVSGYLNLDFGSGFADLTEAQTVCIFETSLTMNIGDTRPITVITQPASASRDNLVWKASAPLTAIYENGKIVGLSAGQSVITASLPSGHTASITVFVKTTDRLLLPRGLTEIEEEAFMNASTLQYVVVPDTVEKIGDFAFSGCASLLEIVIPESVSVISDNAFTGCELLVIRCRENSYAHEYAQAHGISFEFITDSTLNSD